MPNDQPHTYVGKDLEAMSFAENYHQWILSEFEPYLGETVAEVGAGMGSFSSLLLRTTAILRLVAFEPSQNMYRVLQKAIAHDTRAHAVNEYFDEKIGRDCFDSILYVNVLEHIRDDRAELGRARSALRPGGHLLVFVPALAWLYSEFDRQIGHFRRYEKSSLMRLVSDSGLEVVGAKYFDFLGILPWYIVFVLLKKGMSGGSVSLYDKLVVPIMRLVEATVTPPIGKNLLLIARKPRP